MIEKRFGKLLVIERKGTSKAQERLWNCLCDCGNMTIVATRSLNSGNTKSCGCLEKNVIHKMSRTKTYRSWECMKRRCSSPKDINWKNYGANGITYDPSWEKFLNFYKDMGERPVGKTLDRMDNEKGYSKDNCRWATISEQNKNRRKWKKHVD